MIENTKNGDGERSAKLVGIESGGRKVRRFYPSSAVLFGAVSARCGFATCFSRSLSSLCPIEIPYRDIISYNFHNENIFEKRFDLMYLTGLKNVESILAVIVTCQKLQNVTK